MSMFNITITTVLNRYKEMLRRNIPFDEAEYKIRDLQLRRRNIKNASDIELYYKSQYVLKDLQQTIRSQGKSPLYMGMEDFMRYLKETMDEFCVENNKVIHKKQSASRAIVDAIQAVMIIADKLSAKLESKLFYCIDMVVKYGSSAQQQKMFVVLQKGAENNSDFFTPLLKKLQEKLSAS